MKHFFIKYRLFLIALGALILILLIIRKVNDGEVLRKEGVYVIGVVTKVSMGKSGQTIKAYYYFNDKKQNISSSPGFSFKSWVGRRFFIRVLPSNVNLFEIVDYKDVPACYDNEKSMQMVWKDFPSCSP